KDPNSSWNFMRIKGLGFVPGIHCPHFHKEKREEQFKEMVRKHGGIGIALDNNAALEVVGDKYRIIFSQPNAAAYLFYRQKGEVIIEKLEPPGEYHPLSALSQKGKQIHGAD
ncbi:MAG: Type 1 glutamine amidotransferase-like domain-containing protein, partial [Patescibacteria group bacterium]|nr:Type 1 glutamine amidotransferase-like domain-containing protein [Patescibacteria group bacterium]